MTKFAKFVLDIKLRLIDRLKLLIPTIALLFATYIYIYIEEEEEK